MAHADKGSFLRKKKNSTKLITLKKNKCLKIIKKSYLPDFYLVKKPIFVNQNIFYIHSIDIFTLINFST